MTDKIVLFALLVIFFDILPALGAPVHIRGDLRCVECHVTLPFDGIPLLFHSDTNGICSGCHENDPCNPNGMISGFIHPVNVSPSFKVPEDMPLDVEKKIGCMTCHVYHDENKSPQDMNQHMLRRPPGLTFCYTCHKKL